MTPVNPAHPVVILAAGLAVGFSLAFFVLSLPVFRQPTLADRIAPYLGSNTVLAREVRGTPAPRRSGPVGLLAEALERSAHWLSRRLTTEASITSRLDRLGGNASVEGFRARQILCILAGLLAGGGLAGLVFLGRGFQPMVAAVLIVAAGFAGHLVNDWWLTHRVARREAQILAEFPTIAELLSLSIMAGESTVDALERVCRTATGELSSELARALAQARTGTGLVEALDTMARRISIGSLKQFVDGIAVAVSRGTPLAEVLRAQAADVREESRRVLMELSGKKEVGMLVPVVLFVLPVTVVFAVYPSLSVLDIGP